MYEGHSINQYYSKNLFKVRAKKHNTPIRIDKINVSILQSNKSEINIYCSFKNRSNENIILSTSVCSTVDIYGNSHPCKILLDSSSQENFCAYSFARKLGFKLIKNDLPVLGINNSLSQSEYSVKFTLHSRYKSFTFKVQYAVLPDLLMIAFLHPHLIFHISIYLIIYFWQIPI